MNRLWVKMTKNEQKHRSFHFEIRQYEKKEKKLKKDWIFFVRCCIMQDEKFKGGNHYD